MFNGIPSIKEFLSTPEEWHSLVTGFFHSFYKRREIPVSMRRELSEEYHYYVCGRGIGHIAKFIGIVAIGLLVWRKRK